MFVLCIQKHSDVTTNEAMSGCGIGNSYPVCGATKKQITPTNAFSPAKVNIVLAIIRIHQ